MSYVIDSAIFAAFVSECLKILDCHDIITNRNSMLREAQDQPDDFWILLSQDDERRGLRRADVILGIQESEARYFERLTYERCVVRKVGHILLSDPRPFALCDVLYVGYLASLNPLNRVGLQWFLGEMGHSLRTGVALASW